jgi:hypothetical protein
MDAVSATVLELVLAAGCLAHPDPTFAGLGRIEPHTMVRISATEYRFTLAHPYVIDGSWPSGDKPGIHFLGELPDDVCDGMAVYVAGTIVAHELVATTVAADHGKYDGCARFQCHPDADQACRRGGRLELIFE